jgi:predicted nucleic acid-binding protein
MLHGIDTDFLVAVEVIGHPFHAAANLLLDELLDQGARFALAPQTVAEFLHVVTDAKRMPQPLDMPDALERAERWWDAEEVTRVFPDAFATTAFFAALRQHRLGRKRLLDTLLAVTFLHAGVDKIITNNTGDFQPFDGLRPLPFRQTV